MNCSGKKGKMVIIKRGASAKKEDRCSCFIRKSYRYKKLTDNSFDTYKNDKKYHKINRIVQQ